MKYTTKVNTLKIIVELFSDLFENTLIPAKLVAFRTQSDLMEIIGNPKNPKLNKIKDPAEAIFQKFFEALTCTEVEIYKTFEDLYSLDCARQIAKLAFAAFGSGNLGLLREELIALKDTDLFIAKHVESELFASCSM